jgi:flagellar capping protein FliD
VGAFQLKTYAKNPFQVEGVGAQVARSIDDELERMREKFSLMEQQQARAQSALESLGSMAQQLSANSG